MGQDSLGCCVGSRERQKIIIFEAMRILHLVTAFPRDERDIIAPWLVELIKRQRAAGHDVQVFAPSYHGFCERLFAGVQVLRFRTFFCRWWAFTLYESAC